MTFTERLVVASAEGSLSQQLEREGYCRIQEIPKGRSIKKIQIPSSLSPLWRSQRCISLHRSCTVGISYLVLVLRNDWSVLPADLLLFLKENWNQECDLPTDTGRRPSSGCFPKEALRRMIGVPWDLLLFGISSGRSSECLMVEESCGLISRLVMKCSCPALPAWV